jgi:hypothetical protein
MLAAGSDGVHARAVRLLNDPWPWSGTLRGRPLSISDLIDNDTLTLRQAATLRWAIERGASVFVAAGPQGAGKSAVANALLEFLPTDAQVYVTAGYRDRLDMPTTLDGPLYLLVNELSFHMPLYLSGGQARRAFELLRTGARMLGTLHAESAAEAVAVMCEEAELARQDIAAPFILPIVEAWRSGQRILRRVKEIGFLPPCGDVVTLLPDSLGPLATWAGVSVADLEGELTEHAGRLAVRRQ